MSLLGGVYDSSEDDDESDSGVPMASTMAATAAAHVSSDEEEDGDVGALGLVETAPKTSAVQTSQAEMTRAASPATASLSATRSSVDAPIVETADIHAAGTSMTNQVLLPAPDFSGWIADPGKAQVASSAPVVRPLNDRKRPRAGAQIASGFKAAITRHDQMKMQQEADMAAELEIRQRNKGFSSAYDSVFHGANSDDVEQARANQRTKVDRNGRVKPLSKKEIAAAERLEASLRG